MTSVIVYPGTSCGCIVCVFMWMKVTDVMCSLYARSVCVMTVALFSHSSVWMFNDIGQLFTCIWVLLSSVTCVYVCIQKKMGVAAICQLCFVVTQLQGKDSWKEAKKVQKERGYTRFSIEFNLEGREIQWIQRHSVCLFELSEKSLEKATWKGI